MALFAARDERQPVAVFSLEMTKQELVERLISSDAGIDASKLRRGAIEGRDWEKIGNSIGRLNELPIFLDDSGSVTVGEIRSRLRRLKSAHGLGIAFVDYLQLVRPSALGRNVNRNEELSEICRTLKATAKDLEIPIVALAQLNRAVETRQDKRPMLSDLRDCLAADALVTDADTGARIRIADVVEGEKRFNVWATDDELKLVKRPITDAWLVGERQVFEVRTQSGRTIRCTAGHRFRTVDGWSELRELAVDSAIAVPRRYEAPIQRPEMTIGKAVLLGWLVGDGHLAGSPAITVATAAEGELAVQLGVTEFGLKPIVRPERENTPAQRVVLTTGTMCGAGKNPLTTWLRQLGVWKCTGANKYVPAALFGEPNDVIAGFLRGLFHADGRLTRGAGTTRATVRLTTISEELARGVQHLLLRFGISAILKSDDRNIGGYRTTTSRLWTLALMERGSVSAFVDRIGFLGAKHDRAVAKVVREKINDASQFDRIPAAVNDRVRTLRSERAWSHARIGWRDQGKSMSRTTCAMLAERLEDEHPAILAHSDVLWDTIEAIEPAGNEVVYDITVGDLHNFCVDDILTHNSGAIEQEADIVTFLYRDAYYNKEQSPEPDATEFIFAKHRNGRVGMVKLRFRPEHTLFQPYGDESHYSAP
jgi:replicative DNA helicase